MQKIIYTPKEIRKTAKKILNNAANGKIFTFHAPMGAGKTTLIKALIKELGSNDEVSSPTFGLVNEYHDLQGKLLAYHFDFYRLKDEMEALDMGFEDYISSDAWIFIEWPEKIPSFLPNDCSKIKIEIIDHTTRKLSYE